MTDDEKLKSIFESHFRDVRQAQIRWVEVSFVNTAEKTMDAKGITDNLEYYDIQLGCGSFIIYPKVGTLCLIAIIEGMETDALLLSAAEADKIVLNDGQLGGMVKVNELTGRLNLIEKDINSLKQSLTGWSPVANDGGSALKTALSSFMSGTLEETKAEDIENEKVKQ